MSTISLAGVRENLHFTLPSRETFPFQGKGNKEYICTIYIPLHGNIPLPGKGGQRVHPQWREFFANLQWFSQHSLWSRPSLTQEAWSQDHPKTLCIFLITFLFRFLLTQEAWSQDHPKTLCIFLITFLFRFLLLFLRFIPLASARLGAPARPGSLRFGRSCLPRSPFSCLCAQTACHILILLFYINTVEGLISRASIWQLQRPVPYFWADPLCSSHMWLNEWLASCNMFPKRCTYSIVWLLHGWCMCNCCHLGTCSGAPLIIAPVCNVTSMEAAQVGCMCRVWKTGLSDCLGQDHNSVRQVMVSVTCLTTKLLLFSINCVRFQCSTRFWVPGAVFVLWPHIIATSVSFLSSNQLS